MAFPPVRLGDLQVSRGFVPRRGRVGLAAWATQARQAQQVGVGLGGFCTQGCCPKTKTPPCWTHRARLRAPAPTLCSPPTPLPGEFLAERRGSGSFSRTPSKAPGEYSCCQGVFQLLGTNECRKQGGKKKKKETRSSFVPWSVVVLSPRGWPTKKCQFFGEGKEQENQQRGAEQ